ncbi:uncharacterized protein LOC131977492 [Centropristis striata]|uniref:uncharacterized protein LOC131977492 n=1 Tax=Centropristis striata TaxID=184440 RepID=UPI0027E0D043|nr:uncharacterized protein LOC131977492 [Centropristis striata]
MSAVEHLREFVNERLTAAAEEIFGAFKKAVIEYEEEIDRQRRLLSDIVWKPDINVHTTDLPQQHVCKEEEGLPDQLLCNQERSSSSLDQEDPEPPEEQEEVCTSQEGEQLVVKQETDAFMLTPTCEESDHSKDQTLNLSVNETRSVSEEKHLNYISVKNSVAPEANTGHQLFSHNFQGAESQYRKRAKKKPKLKSCPNCGVNNNASRKTCVSCYVCLLQRKTIKEKETALKTGNWAQKTLKHRNGARVVASAHIAVSKLAALGYNPILLIGKQKKGVNSVTAETITHMCPGGDGPMKPFVEEMSRAYEYIVKNSNKIQSTEAPAPLPPPQSNTSPFQSSFPPHPPHPSTFLSPSSSHPPTETNTVTLSHVPSSLSTHLPPAPPPAQQNIDKSVPTQHCPAPTPSISLSTGGGQQMKRKKGVPTQPSPSTRPTISLTTGSTSSAGEGQQIKKKKASL